MKYLVAVLCFFAAVSMAKADMLDAMKAYENKDYDTAYNEFSALIPLGNGLAAFNLGAMYYHGESQPQDTAMAMAYFMLASELDYTPAIVTLHNIKDISEPAQYLRAEKLAEDLRQRIRIKSEQRWVERVAMADATVLPKPLRRVEPKYPIAAIRDGKFGYVNLRFLVDEKGQVKAVDVLDSFPRNVFESEAKRALLKWKYETSDRKHLLKVRLDFSIEGGVSVAKVEKFSHEYNLWQYANMSSPQHQLILGTLLELSRIQSAHNLAVDRKMPAPVTPDYTVFQPLNKPPKADFPAFWGSAVVRVAKDGTIIEQISTRFDDKNKQESLIGLKLTGEIETDVYKIRRYPDIHSSKAWVQASLLIPKEMSGHYWWLQSAINGNLEAQRIIAAQNGGEWERYLLELQDPQVMAWTGTQMILDGKRDEGLLLIDKAVASKYEPASALKKLFM